MNIFKPIISIFKSKNIQHSSNSVDIIEPLLKMLNVEYQKVDGDNKGETEGVETTYRFQYQDGHFSLVAYSDKTLITIRYLYFFDTELDNLHIVNKIINKINACAFVSRLIYVYDESTNKIVVHILSNANINDTTEATRKMLASILMSNFAIHRDFLKSFEQIAEMTHHDSTDVEYDELRSERDRFLLAESELYNFADTPTDYHFCANNKFTIDWLLNNIFVLESQMQLVGLKIITSTIARFTDADTIRELDFRQFLLDASGEICKESIWNFDFAKANLLLHISHETSTEHTEFFRITATSIYSRTHISEAPMQFLIAFDKTTEREMNAEFDYMWQDAIEKYNDNKNSEEMTKEQELICRISNSQMSHDVYWGAKYFYECRYVEAIKYLERPFAYFRKHAYSLKSYETKIFVEIAYMIGSCYDSLGLYQQAYYYLDGTESVGHKYLVRYVNSLVNSGDMRAQSQIEHMLNNIEAHINNEEENDSKEDASLRGVYQFLLRRKAFVLINNRELTEAESLLMSMLKNPQTKEFAEKQLKRVMNLRKNDFDTNAFNESNDDNEAEHDDLQ